MGKGSGKEKKAHNYQLFFFERNSVCYACAYAHAVNFHVMRYDMV